MNLNFASLYFLEQIVKPTLKKFLKHTDLEQLRSFVCFFRNFFHFLNSGEPAPKISWYKDANILRKSKTTEFLFDGKNANLLIKPTESGSFDEILGAYTCRAENAVEQKQTSINISKTSLNSLTFKGGQAEDSSYPSTVDRHNRTPSTSSMPAPGTSGKQSTESLISTESRALTTPASVGLRKKGNIKRVSSAMFLRLLAPLQDQEVKIGETLFLSCSISCSERPSVFWYLDGEELDLDDSENVYGDGKCTLKLKNVDKTYEGVYECIIQSQQTEITSCCSVKVCRLNFYFLSNHSNIEGTSFIHDTWFFYIRFANCSELHCHYKKHDIIECSIMVG